MTRRPIHRGKTTAAVVGGCALIAMGIIGSATGGIGDAPRAIVSDGSMSTGETTTITYSGTIAPIVAKPVVTAKPYGAA